MSPVEFGADDKRQVPLSPEPPTQPAGLGGEQVRTDRIARYILLRRLGVGGMGAVYAAYDPKLNRRVALKLLHPGMVASEQARRRLLREARALARLSHANVVQVHDVDIAGEDVYVVMEFIQGTSLRQYCKPARNPGWRQVMDVYLAAARGLAAAHDKGLVHRDFKPSNVLVDGNGLVKVLDFGLAASAWAAVDESVEGGLEDSIDRPRKTSGQTADSDFVEADTAVANGAGRRALLDTDAPAQNGRSGERLTMSGVVMGTPAYMAPEQHEGGSVDLSADIYGFCASLYEGIFGHLPFAIDGLGNSDTDQLEILRRKLTREIVEPRSDEGALGADVPDWVRAVILRGLQPEPGDRWPSMHALIAALENDPVARRRERIRLFGGGLLLVALLGVALFGWLRDERSELLCQGAGDEIAEVWNPHISARIRSAFKAAGRVNAEATYGRLATVLDDYARSWVTMKNGACAATYVRREQSQVLLDLRMQCLDRRKHQLQALTGVLLAEHGDSLASDSGQSPREVPGEVIDKSIQAALHLPAIDVCADASALTAAYPPPVDRDTRARVVAIERRLDRAEAREGAGQYRAGQKIADSAMDESRAVEYPPLRARALFAAARLSDKNSEPDRAESLLRTAMGHAARARDDLLLARMWAYLVRVMGVVQARHDDALALRLTAETAVERAGDDGVRSALFSTLGSVLGAKGRFEDALAMHQRALAIGEEALGPEHLRVAAARNEMGNLQYFTGRYNEAIQSYEQVLAVRESALGSMHPEVAKVLNNMGITYAELGDFGRAQEMHERALTIREAVLGADHLRLAASLNNLGRVLQRVGAHKRSRALHERALTIRLGKLGPDHPLVASARVNLGITLYSLGDYEGARTQLRDGLAIREQRLGRTHPAVARTYVHLGNVNALTGALEPAQEQYRQALARIEESLGLDHAVAIMALTGLARIAVQRNQWEPAREHLEQALAIQERTVGLQHFEAIPVLMVFAELAGKSDHSRLAVDYWQRALALAERVESGLVADCRMGLAQALGPVGHERARELAEQARTYFASVGHRRRVEQIERWLSSAVAHQ